MARGRGEEGKGEEKEKERRWIGNVEANQFLSPSFNPTHHSIFTFLHKLPSHSHHTPTPLFSLTGYWALVEEKESIQYVMGTVLCNHQSQHLFAKEINLLCVSMSV